MSKALGQYGEMSEEVAETTTGVADYMAQRAALEDGKIASMDLDAILDPGGDSPPAEEADKAAAKRSQDGAGDSAPTNRDTSGGTKSEQDREDGVRGKRSATKPESEDERGSGDEPPDEAPPWLAKFERRITRRAEKRHAREMAQKDREIAALREQLGNGTAAADAGDGSARTETAGDGDPLDEPYPRKEDYGDDQAAFDADVERWNNGEQLAGPPGKRERRTQQRQSEQDGTRSADEGSEQREAGAGDRIEDLALDLAEILDERSGDEEDLDQELRDLGKARRISLTETMLEHMVDGMEEESVERAVRAIIKRPLSARKIARLPAGQQAAALDKLAAPPDDGEDREERRAESSASRRSLRPSTRAPEPEKSDMDFTQYLVARKGEDQRAYGGIDSLN